VTLEKRGGRLKGGRRPKQCSLWLGGSDERKERGGERSTRGSEGGEEQKQNNKTLLSTKRSSVDGQMYLGQRVDAGGENDRQGRGGCIKGEGVLLKYSFTSPCFHNMGTARETRKKVEMSTLGEEDPGHRRRVFRN